MDEFIGTMAEMGVNRENGINCTLSFWERPKRSELAFLLLPAVISHEV